MSKFNIRKGMVIIMAWKKRNWLIPACLFFAASLSACSFKSEK